jgi:hypothetical protein
MRQGGQAKGSPLWASSWRDVHSMIDGLHIFPMNSAKRVLAVIGVP